MADEIHICLKSIGDDSHISVAEGSKLLSDEEVEKANAYKFRTHRERYIRGRALLRQILSSYTDTSPEKLAIFTEKRGKPFLKEQGVTFNLSHSGDLALYAVTTSFHRIGADIELTDRDSDIDGLSKYCFTEAECAEMQRQPAHKRRDMFFQIWTAKEARMKLTGEGLHLEPRSIDLKFEDGMPAGFRKPTPGGQSVKVSFYPEFGAIGSVVADRLFELRRIN